VVELKTKIGSSKPIDIKPVGLISR